ncbi:MAG: endolytic transglycosylase MltG [Ilumatobacter sp.]|uniref:endolytic transglycosylase MltG n=1 Tax=Ilumatobacter sp. TaxID=1967498 RepID=UPI003C730E74
MTTDLDPLLPEAEVDAADRPAIDWPTDPWDNSDRTGTVERLRRQTRPLKWAVYSVLCLSIVAIMIAGAVGWWYLQRLNPPGDPGPVEGFTVAEGETLESLSERLEDEGFVEDAGVFVQYVENKVGDDDEFEIVPGFYELRPGDHVGNVMGRLGVPPAQTSRSVTFPEGFTLAQMARRVGTEFETLSADGFTAATQDEYILPWEPPGGAASLEGLLFPDTYDVSNADSEGQLVQRMIDIMQRVGNQEDIVTKGAALGRTPYEILIIASMIEKEAKVPEDRARISRVIHNRLFVTQSNPDEEPFRLQIDAAVLYGRNQLGIDPDTPFSEVRQMPSDWNTYLLPGLPKTPIASPGRASIEAALNPAPNPAPGDPICRDLPQPDQCFYFFYVLADEDGSHVFAATGEQHEANVQVARQAGLL